MKPIPIMYRFGLAVSAVLLLAACNTEEPTPTPEPTAVADVEVTEETEPTDEPTPTPVPAQVAVPDLSIADAEALASFAVKELINLPGGFALSSIYYDEERDKVTLMKKLKFTTIVFELFTTAGFSFLGSMTFSFLILCWKRP